MPLDSPLLAKPKLDVTLVALLKSVGSVGSGTGTVLVMPLDSPLVANLKLEVGGGLGGGARHEGHGQGEEVP